MTQLSAGPFLACKPDGGGAIWGTSTGCRAACHAQMRHVHKDLQPKLTSRNHLLRVADTPREAIDMQQALE